ncbi:MAG: PEGA domain-containing protein, partial [Cystobacter sp.]
TQAPARAERSPAAPAAPPVLTIETEPAGARISVDGQEVGVSPLTLDTLPLGEHLVTATREDRLPAQRQVKLSHPGERAMVVLALAAPPVEPPAPAAAAEPRGTAPSASKVVQAPEPQASTVGRASRRAMGRLTLDTTPWTYVYLRGRKLGDTPLIDVPIPAGRHQLKLVNEGKNISTVVEVEVRAGQSTTKKLRL